MLSKGYSVRTEAPGTQLIAAIDPIKARMTALMVFCIVFAGAITFRAALVQIASNPRLEQMARRQFQSKVLVRPRRGAIVDRNGEPLAINVETSSLAANPSKVENPHALAKLIARTTDLPIKRVLAKLQRKPSGTSPQFVWIKRHLSDGELKRMRKGHVMDADGDLVGGLMLIKESKRVYPHGELASHLMGSVNIDSEGLEGVELWQNEKMSGKVISVSAIKDAKGRPAFIDAVSAKNVQDHRDGAPVELTIDASLQFAVEQQLKASVVKAQAKGGTVIVMNAVNGEILAMANQPSYNPNDKGVPVDHRRNRAITDGYEPGSTLKSVLIASALSHGWKLTDTIWGERGSFTVQGKKISEAESHEKYEWLNLNQLIQYSSNVGAAKVALKLGADHYLSTLRTLGFGTKSGTGFPGEIAGQIPPRKTWQPLTLANVGFGQGILVTPIQMVRAYAAFLNGGWLVQPRLLREEAKEPWATPGKGARRVFTQRVADQMLEVLEGPLKTGGTGIKAALPGYRIAGKTGTAQKVDPGTHGYSRNKYVASFIGMPLDVDSKIVIFAAIDEPRGIYYASETAAPLFREVLNSVANRFSLPTRGDLPKPQLASASAPVSDTMRLGQSHPAPAGARSAVFPVEPSRELQFQGEATNGRSVWVMPALRGLTPREALRALQGHPFKVELKGVGVVRSQWPEGGKPLAEGELVKLQLGEP